MPRLLTVRLANGKTRDAHHQGLGRHAHWSEQNEAYLLADYTPHDAFNATEASGAKALAGDTSRHWNDDQWWGDQGDFPACTGFASVAYAEDGPITQKVSPVGTPIVDGMAWYHLNVTADRQEGRWYDEGATVLAACQVAKALGVIGAYYWVTTLDDLVKGVLTLGPALAGTEWYPEMSAAGPKDGWMPKVRATSRSLGGHCYVINGVDVRGAFLWMKNSWDRSRFGKKGRARIPFETAERLIRESGEFAFWRELRLTKLPKVTP